MLYVPKIMYPACPENKMYATCSENKIYAACPESKDVRMRHLMFKQ